MSDDSFIKSLDCIGALAKWFILQMLLYFLIPHLWNYEYGIGIMTLMFIYTAFHVVYWTFIPKEMRIKWLWTPYFIYTILALILYGIIDNWCSSISFCLLLPLYGLVCWIGIKLFRKYSKEDKREMQVRQSDIIFGCSIIASRFEIVQRIMDVQGTWYNGK